MSEIETILGICIGLIVGLIIIVYWRKRRDERQKKIDIQKERIKLASKPGYEPPGRKRMWTTIKDGVITYRKDKTPKEDKEKSGR